MPHADDDHEPETTDEPADAGSNGPDESTPDAPTLQSPAVDEAAEPASTSPTPPHDVPPVRGSNLDTRTLGIGAIAVGALLLAFLLGMAVRGDSHDDDPRGTFAAQRGEAPGGQVRGPGSKGGPGGRARGGQHGGRGPAFGARGEHGRGSGGTSRRMSRGGGMGTVEAASDDELTIAPLRGDNDLSIIASIDDDTRVVTRGDAGPRDIEEIDVSDIGEGDIVMVRGTPTGDDDEDARRIDAKVVMVLRASGE